MRSISALLLALVAADATSIAQTPAPEVDLPELSICPKANQEWKQCGSACPPTCGVDGIFSCTMECVVGCGCSSGFKRSSTAADFECVAEDACPAPPPRQEGETCGWVFGPGFVGDCAADLECMCVGACANPMIADAPATCVRPAVAGAAWRRCTKSDVAPGISTIAGMNLAAGCNRKECFEVHSANDCRNLKFHNCDGADCEGANYNARTGVCRLCKSTAGTLRSGLNDNKVALAAKQEAEPRGSATPAMAMAGAAGAAAAVIAATVAACVIVVAARRRGAQREEQDPAAEFQNVVDC